MRRETAEMFGVGTSESLEQVTIGRNGSPNEDQWEREGEARRKLAAIRQASAEAAWLAGYGHPRIVADPSAIAAERLRRIGEAAYFKALRRDFAPGHEVQDWLEAEREIDDALGEAARLPDDEG